jgi:hypothetical protein
MKSVDEAEAQVQLNDIPDEAQEQPIAIRRAGADIAVLLSIPEYERLRVALARAFLAFRDEIDREASASGLTMARLSELLGGD